MPKYMPLAEWKAAVEAGTPPTDVILHKTGLVEITAGETPESRTVDFTISTGAVDREKDVINPDGWDLKHYKKSPVVLFAHDYRQPPIGRTTKLRQVDGALKATVEFAPKEANPMAETIYQLVRGGYLSSASVGFRPQKHVFNAERGGVDFEAQELLEWSIVPVPANPEALVDGKAAGIDTAPLIAWAKGIIAMADADGIVTKPRTLKPTDGKCPVGYTMGSDGMCHEKAADAAAPKAPMHKPGCTDTACPGGEACEGKALAECNDKNLRQLWHADRELGQRLDRLEMALVQLVPKSDPEPIYVLALAEAPPSGPDVWAVDPATVTAALDAALQSVVAREVQAAVNTLRGRVD